MKTVVLAALAAIILAGCVERTPEERAALAIMMMGGLNSYGNAQGQLAQGAINRIQPTTCMPTNRYISGGGFTCY